MHRQTLKQLSVKYNKSIPWIMKQRDEYIVDYDLIVKMATYGSSISNIWVYRTDKWFVYTKDLFYLESIKSNLNVGTFDNIKSGEGFWIYVE